jgi:hypothetical protein
MPAAPVALTFSVRSVSNAVGGRILGDLDRDRKKPSVVTARGGEGPGGGGGGGKWIDDRFSEVGEATGGGEKADGVIGGLVLWGIVPN